MIPRLRLLLTLLLLLAGAAAIPLGLCIQGIRYRICSIPLLSLLCGFLYRIFPSSSGPNIVLFYADDLDTRSLEIVNSIVKTPHLNEMAANGIFFDYNCVIYSICWISRATLMTGLYAAVHRQFKISSEEIFGRTVRWSDTLYPRLKSAGYHVGFVGKW